MARDSSRFRATRPRTRTAPRGSDLFTRIHIESGENTESGEAEALWGENPVGSGGAFDLGDHGMESYLPILFELTN